MPVAEPQLLRTDKADDRVRDHVRNLVGVQPYTHNYYAGDRFILNERERGIVRNLYGQRMLLAPEEFIPAVASALEDELGEASANEIMYRIGISWGKRDMARFAGRMQREFEVQFASTNMIFMLESWWWPLTTMGWGAWRLDFGQAKQGMIFIDIFESAVAKSLGNVGHVVCHFYAGQFAGAFSYFAKRDLACIEVQCYAMGEEYCKFLVSSSKRVNAVSFWRNEGASPKDILGKLAAADSEDG